MPCQHDLFEVYHCKYPTPQMAIIIIIIIIITSSLLQHQILHFGNNTSAWHQATHAVKTYFVRPSRVYLNTFLTILWKTGSIREISCFIFKIIVNMGWWAGP
jgi:hypothetical protein